MPKTGSGRNSTSTDHRLQIEKPMCSEKIEKNRLRRATFLPVDSQNWGSSGRQSSIQFRGRPVARGGAATVFGGALVVGTGGGGHAMTVATARFPGVALAAEVVFRFLTAADPLW